MLFCCYISLQIWPQTRSFHPAIFSYFYIFHACSGLVSHVIVPLSVHRCGIQPQSHSSFYVFYYSIFPCRLAHSILPCSPLVYMYPCRLRLYHRLQQLAQHGIRSTCLPKIGMGLQQAAQSDRQCFQVEGLNVSMRWSPSAEGSIHQDHRLLSNPLDVAFCMPFLPDLCALSDSYHPIHQLCPINSPVMNDQLQYTPLLISMLLMASGW